MPTERKIQELSLEAVMGERFGRYSKYIIQERALPDIRDGLKPVQRRVLFRSILYELIDNCCNVSTYKFTSEGL